MSSRSHCHLLRVTASADAFAPLLEAAASAGIRIGWLSLRPPEVIPPSLGAAADLGVLRAVAVGDGRAVVVKPMRGAPVLRDLLREHFRGCALVLVEAPEDAAGMDDTPASVHGTDDGSWQVVPNAGGARTYGTTALLEALRRPRPWAD